MTNARTEVEPLLIRIGSKWSPIILLIKKQNVINPLSISVTAALSKNKSPYKAVGILRTWRQRVESSFQAMFFPRVVFTGRIWIADCIDDYSDDSAPVCYN